MHPSRSAKYLAIAFVGCVTAAVMLVAFDFAGWETGEFSTRTTFTSRADPVDIFRTRVSRDDRTVANFYYSSVSVYGPYAVLIAPVVALLVFGAYVSYRGLRSGSESVAGNSLRRAFWAAVIAAAAALVGGILFEVVMAVYDPSDWWQDAGFYRGFSAAATAAVFLWLAMRLDGTPLRGD